MSYILDALKKADSERQHGKIPSIHTQTQTHRALPAEESALKNPMIWFFLIVLVVMLGAFFLFNNWQSTPPAVVVAPPVTAVAPPIIAAAPNPSTTAHGTAMQEPSAEVSAATVGDAPVVAPRQSEPATLNPIPKEKTRIKKEKRSPQESSSKKSASKQVIEAPAETVEMTFRDLPQSIQNEIPTLTVGGYLYSGNHAASQLLINKLLLREGEQIAPGLTLEKLMPHSAILNYKGY